MAAPATEIITELLQQIQSLDCPEAQTAALHSLSSLTKVSSHNRSLVAATPGAVPLLLSLIISAAAAAPSSAQTLSLSVLFNLSLNTNLKLSLAQTPNLITLLNSLLLSSKSPHAAKLAASVLCSLAMLDKNKAPLGVAGTVEVIVEALRRSTDDVSSSLPANHHLLSALAELLHFHGNCTLAVRAGAVPLLVGSLECPPEELAGSLTVLGLLARFEEGIKAITAVDGVVSLMIGGLKKGCMVSRESAAEILVKLFEENGDCLMEAAVSHEWSSLLADLSIRGSARAREKAAVLMRMMMENDLDGYLDMEGNYMD